MCERLANVDRETPIFRAQPTVLRLGGHFEHQLQLRRIRGDVSRKCASSAL